MSKNKGQAITRNMIRKNGRGGTQICGTTFLLALGFVWTVIVCMYAAVLYYVGFNDYTFSSRYIVAVNAPESFRTYEDLYPYEESIIFYEEWGAPYDFMKMSEFMHEHAAGIVIVFPRGFDDQIKSGINPEVLSYYRTDTLDYKGLRDNFNDDYLAGYKRYLTDVFNLPEQSDSWNVTRGDIPTNGGMPGYMLFARAMGRNFIPILLFIALLYAAMSNGTEAISGQKERGTFSRILLTPVPRKDIIKSFTNGVFISASIPALVIIAFAFLIPFYRHLTSLLPLILLTLSLSLFISALTVMISVMNDTVSSAQTAFLPVFFILVSVAVTCINGGSDPERFYYYLPVYGQFYGLGDAFNGEPHIIASTVCSALTASLALIVTLISTKILSSEKFTSPSPSEDENAGNTPTLFSSFIDSAIGMFDVIFFPLFILSVFQIIAMIPIAVVYTGNPVYSDFIADLANVSTVGEIMGKAMEIIGIFMNDSRFLALMSLSYILIILSCMHKAKGPANVGLIRKDFGKLYVTGLIYGTVLMTLVFIALIITGKADVHGIQMPSPKTLFMFSVIMWIPQGAAEEVMFRGYMIPKVKSLFKNNEKAGRIAAIAISSAMFSVSHAFNGGFNLTALVNIFLFAVLFALIYERTGSIALTCAAHTMWNMFQGNIFGLSVSGNETVPSIIETDYTGSDFGPEGTLEATLVIMAALVLFAVMTRRKQSSPNQS